MQHLVILQYTDCVLHNLSQQRVWPSEKPSEHNVWGFFASKCQYYPCPLHKLPVTSRVWYPSYSGCVGQLKLPGDVSLHLVWSITGIAMLSISGNEMFHVPCSAPLLHNLSPWRVKPSDFTTSCTSQDVKYIKYNSFIFSLWDKPLKLQFSHSLPTLLDKMLHGNETLLFIGLTASLGWVHSQKPVQGCICSVVICWSSTEGRVS